MRSTKISLLLALPLALAVGMGAEPIQSNWLGGDAPEAVPIIQIFSVLFVVVAATLPAESILLGLGFVRLLALTGLAQAALIVGLGIPMTRDLGAVGLAFAALVAVVSVHTGVILPVAVARVGIEPGRLLRGAIGSPLLAAAPVAAVMYYLRDRIALGGLAALAAWAGGAALIYAVLLWCFGFDREERTFLSSHLNRLLLDRSRITDWDEPE
jgi:O-antigen/teichoic acid export membrane protein